MPANDPSSASEPLTIRQIAFRALTATFEQGLPHPRFMSSVHRKRLFGVVIPKKRWAAALSVIERFEATFIARLQRAEQNS